MVTGLTVESKREMARGILAMQLPEAVVELGREHVAHLLTVADPIGEMERRRECCRLANLAETESAYAAILHAVRPVFMVGGSARG